jgi:hypothetical protein
MEKIIAKVNAFLSQFCIACIVCKVPCDKQMHFISGFLIALVLTPFIGLYSIAVVAVIATAKELYDDMNKDIHTPDIWDLVVTVLGGALGFVLVNLL